MMLSTVIVMPTALMVMMVFVMATAFIIILMVMMMMLSTMMVIVLATAFVKDFQTCVTSQILVTHLMLLQITNTAQDTIFISKKQIKFIFVNNDTTTAITVTIFQKLLLCLC